MRKPRLSQYAWQLVLAMHKDGKICSTRCAINSATVRNELLGLDLLCYSEGWKLTKRGKLLARYLTGHK